MKSKILWECLICAGQGSVADSEMNEHVSCIRGSSERRKGIKYKMFRQDSFIVQLNN